MMDQTHKPNDPLFLFSRSLDEALSEEDRNRLDASFAASQNLVRERVLLQAVDHLIHRWATEVRTSDPSEFEAGVMAKLLGEGHDSDLADVDRSIRGWGASHPRFENVDLVTSIRREVTRHERAHPARRWIFRLGMPLAAAASVALAFIGFSWFEPTAVPVRTVVIGPEANVVMPDLPEPASSRIVLFERTAVVFNAPAGGNAPVAIISIGDTPVDSTGEESPL